jgi:hypothetical protein
MKIAAGLAGLFKQKMLSRVRRKRLNIPPGLLLPVKKWFKLHAPQLAVAGTLLSPFVRFSPAWFA